MAMINARSLKTTLKIFFKDAGRFPEFNEFRNLILGRNNKEETKADEKQEEPKS